MKPARADLVEHGDRRHVERHLQRPAHRHRALEREIEILRRIGAVAHRAILDQRLGMDEAVLEAEPVDERLQRRARRAQRLRHVDLAGAALVEIIGRGDARQHFAGGVVDGEDGDGDVGAERTGALARERLRGFSAAPRRWSACAAGAPAFRRRPDRRHAAPASASACARSAPARPWRSAISSAGTMPAAAKRSSTRLRARRAMSAERSGRRSSGDCGSATSSAASPSESLRGSLPK